MDIKLKTTKKWMYTYIIINAILPTGVFGLLTVGRFLGTMDVVWIGSPRDAAAAGGLLALGLCLGATVVLSTLGTFVFLRQRELCHKH